ncbi:MAG: hypothetical protein IKX81_00150 [Firmicutes bacterium]|nr:hypothetical protein [Bacillota bacterium]
MGLLRDLSDKYKTLSIVGMAKNAGKTTALNFLIEEAMDEGVILGVTSTGRDGETQDLVTGTEKPRVYLDQGSLVSVPSQLYELADAGLEILERTRYSTAIGELLICRVQDAGYVQVAGPVIAAETKKLCADMFRYGVDLVLIDGAIDRKSVANPETSDAIILSTGAVLSRSLKNVVEETAHIVELYELPEFRENREVIDFLKEDNYEHITVFDAEGKPRVLDLITGLGASGEINEAIGEDTKYIFIPGAMTNSVISDISLKNLKQVEFILKDPTKIFISNIDWGRLRKRGLKIKVLRNIEIAAITVNPWSPKGYSFDSDLLISAMKEVLTDIPVIDVRR